MRITVMIYDVPYVVDLSDGSVYDEYGLPVEDPEVIATAKSIAENIVREHSLEELAKEDVDGGLLLDLTRDRDYYMAMAQKFADLFEEKVIPSTVKTIRLFESLSRLMTLSTKPGTRSRTRKLTRNISLKISDGRIIPVFHCCVVGDRMTYDINGILETIDEMALSRRKIRRVLEELADESEKHKIEKLFNALEVYARLR